MPSYKVTLTSGWIRHVVALLPGCFILGYMLSLPAHALTGVSGFYMTLLLWWVLWRTARYWRELADAPTLTLYFNHDGYCWCVPSTGDADAPWQISVKSRVIAGAVYICLQQPRQRPRHLWVLPGECSERGLRRLARVITRKLRAPRAV